MILLENRRLLEKMVKFVKSDEGVLWKRGSLLFTPYRIRKVSLDPELLGVLERQFRSWLHQNHSHRFSYPTRCSRPARCFSYTPILCGFILEQHVKNGYLLMNTKSTLFFP